MTTTTVVKRTYVVEANGETLTVDAVSEPAARAFIDLLRRIVTADYTITEQPT